MNKIISKIIFEINSQLKQCEKNIKEFLEQNIDNGVDHLIRLNMKKSLFTKFKDFTKRYKINQEIYTKKYKDLSGGDDPSINENIIDEEESNEGNNNFLMSDNSNQTLKKRDTELSQLLSSVNDLAEIYKDMQTLVMEQGSILDRIDYNIDVAATNVSTGKKSIVKANEYHKSSCFRNAIIILIVVIFFEALMIIFKFAN